MAELPSLAEFLRELRGRIMLYSRDFERDAELVKSALVEPFFRLMGWDPEDPGEVRPRYRTPVGIADYALFADGNLLALVAVGRLGDPGGDVQKHLRMCVVSGASYLIATDGASWRVYHRDNGERPVLSWNLLEDRITELFKDIDAFRRLLGLESGGYEELVCYTRGGREVRVKALENMEGLLFKRMKRAGGIPYAHIARMLREGKIVFLSGSGIDNKNITYVRKRLEQELGAEVECVPAIYDDVMGYSLALKKKEGKVGRRRRAKAATL